MLKSKIMIGSISYLHPDMYFLEERISYHEQQVRMWERFNEGCPFYRTEISWDKSTEKALFTSQLDLHSIKVDAPCYVGKARNKILQVFYNSDFDYLVLCDDDCVFDPEEECFDFIRNLGPIHAKREELFIFPPETFFNKGDLLNRALKRQEIPGYLIKPSAALHGMAICMIPNIVKYGNQPVFFHEMDTSESDTPTEDASFLAQWFKLKCPAYDMMFLFSNPLDCSKKSAVFQERGSRTKTAKSRLVALDTYIQKLFPTRGSSRLTYKKLYTKNPAWEGGMKCMEATIPRCKLNIESV